MTDNIFARLHSLQRSVDGQALPLLIQDNSSSDFSFPVSVQEFARALGELPGEHGDGITHIWLRRMPTKRRSADAPLAEFICGSGVRVIIIYPWPSNGKLYVGRDKPNPQSSAAYLKFGASITCERGRWYIQFAEADLKRYYVQHLFCHEIGHHVDWYGRQWSKANVRKVENFADQYAVQWGPRVTAVLNEK